MCKSLQCSQAPPAVLQSQDCFVRTFAETTPPKIEETIDADIAVYLNSLQPPTHTRAHLVYGAHLVRLILSTLGLLPVRVYIYSANQSQLREIP